MTLGLTRLRNRPFAMAMALFVFGGTAQLHALTINLTFDSSVTSLANAASYEAATDYAAQQLEALFSDNITINIDVVAVSGTGVFGESEYGLIGSSYGEVRAALIAHATSANDLASLVDLPMTDPTNGAAFYVNLAEAKVLGLTGPGSDSDGTFYFGTGYNFALSSSNRAMAGEYDFIGVAEHEMTEIMGRSAVLGGDINGSPAYIPYDLFRFSGVGVRSLVGGQNNYFSIDNGTTNLMAYNFPDGDGSDPQDWAATTPYTADCCNNAAESGKLNAFTTVDTTAMDVIGYTLASSPPAFTDGPAPTTATFGTPYSFTYTATLSPTFALATGTLPPGLTLVNGVLSGTPNLIGSYSGTISATANGVSSTQNFNITVSASTQPLTFALWSALYFTAAQLNDPTISGPTAIPRADGVCNLIKYICDIDPSHPMTAVDRAALPKLTTANSGATLVYTYRQFALSAVIPSVQTSMDLANWSSAGTPTVIGHDSSTSTDDPIMQIQVAVSGTKQFVQLSALAP